MGDAKKIWVIGGRDGYAIGDETIELMTEAGDLSKKTDCDVSVVIFGTELEDTIQMLAKRKTADRLYVFESETYKNYDPEAYMSALEALAVEQMPDIILISATSMGRDLAPRLAYQLKGNLMTNIQQIQFTANGTVKTIKPIYGGKANANSHFSGNPPYIATVIPGVIGVSKKKGAKSTEIVMRSAESVDSETAGRGYTVVEFVTADPRTIDIAEADVVVAGGRGVAGEKGFRALEKFAYLIGGAVGCSRPIVDRGILKLERQVGQTGKTVTPELFISCGISGAMQHEMGMKDAKYIIAVNTDEDAPVFRISDYKVVADVNAVLPEMIKSLKARQKEAASDDEKQSP